MSKNKKYCIVLSLLFFLISTLSIHPVFAELLNSPTWGYSLDLPEGFVLMQTNSNDRYIFSSDIVNVDLVISCYNSDKFINTDEALKTVIKQLGGTGQTIQTTWRNRDCSIAQTEMNLQQKEKYSSWAIALELPYNKGYLVLVCYTPQAQAAQNEAFMISTLDCIVTDRGSWFETGPMTAFAYPNEGEKEVQISIGEKSFPIIIDSLDSEAGQYVVDREFSILNSYLKSDLWLPAWQRYYRMIYRDSYKRLKRTAFAIQTNMPTAANPEEKYQLANKLLQWTQTFTYQRNFEGSDFTCLTDTLSGTGGDCDSRALLLAVLLKQLGYKTILFVSHEYSHSIVGVDVEGKGARMEVDGIKYLVGETTAKVTLGLIAQDMSDPNKWIPVAFPE